MTNTKIHDGERNISKITEEVQALWPGFHHQVLGEIGMGGCGRIVKINWTASGKPAVLKYLLSALEPSLTDESHFHNLSHGQWKKFLEQEARIMVAFAEYEAAMNVLDLHSNYQAFVMDFIPGGTLLEHITEPLDWQEKVRRFLPVLDFLAALQDEGIYHRDVTLDNILIHQDGSLKLADLGLAHNIYEPIIQAIPGGKPGYKYPNPRRLINKQRLRNDIQDVFSSTICLLGWISRVDPNTVSSSSDLLSHCPDQVLQALTPVIQPEERLPPFGEGSGSFTLLASQLRSLVDQRVKPKSAISYLSIQDTYTTFVASEQPTIPAQVLNVPENVEPVDLSSLYWFHADDFDYTFPPVEIVRALASTMNNWPAGIGGNPVPCIYDSNFTAQVTWEQAQLCISPYDFDLPSREQSGKINLPAPVLQFWLNEKKTEHMALIGPCIGGLDRFEPINTASPFRVFCIIKNREQTE